MTKMTKIINFANEKGGVMKTTSCIHYAAYEAKTNNKKVIIIDCETQASIDVFFRDRKDAVCIGDALDLYDGENTISAPDWEENAGKVLYYRGGINLVEVDQLSPLDVIDNIKKSLSALDADIIVVDNSPSLGVRLFSNLAIADGIIIPTDFSVFANEGLQHIINDVKKVKTIPVIKSPVIILGLLPTLIDGNDKDQKQRLQDQYKIHKNAIMRTPLRVRPVAKTAINQCKLIWELPKGKALEAKKEFTAACAEISKRVKGSIK
jgi:chromosome partitioning protein